jgi:predicted ATPase/class 3 adenylate cyclase
MTSQPQLATPSGIVTFLFTDVESSTRLWEDHPSQMDAAMARHDEIMRLRIEQHRGYVFSVAGDAFAAAFHTPNEAAQASIAVQQDLAEEPWPEPIRIRVRIGLHTGVAEERGGDYFGPVLNRAARLMSAGHGGQVLVSAATKELLADHGFVDLGEHRLKDLSAPEHLFQLDIAGLDAHFAPLRTLTDSMTNLPIRMASFVGREDEVSMLVAKLLATRAVTLCGPGGVGKTTLGIQVGAEADHGGAWLVELAPVSEDEAVPYQFAAALGATVDAGKSPIDAVIQRLGSSPAVLVIDNCEHLRDAAAKSVRSILAACPEVRVVASSREPLGLPGEFVYPVSPLAVTSDGPAVQLLIDRLRDANPALDIDTTRRQVLVEICEKLDGLPLAIELAAARARSMTPEDINGRLGERFRLLRNRRGVQERHATLRATIEWSYQMLDEIEQALLERLSVFSGDFSVAAAEQVCTDGDLDELDVFDALDSLVERSMVVADLHAEHAAYSLLFTIRDFAAEELGDQAERFRRRHAVFYAGWLPAVLERTHTGQERDAVAELDAGWDNIRAALRYTEDAADLDLNRSILSSLIYEAMFRNRAEVGEWVRSARRLHGADFDGPPFELSVLEVICASIGGDHEFVARRGVEVAARILDADAVELRGLDITVLGFALSLAGIAETPRQLFELGDEVAASTGTRQDRVWTLGFSGLAASYAGDEELAETKHQEARRHCNDSDSISVRIGLDLNEALRGKMSPAATVATLDANAAIASTIRAELIRNISLMVSAGAKAKLGDLSEALAEAASTLDGHRLSGAFAATSQQLRRSLVLLLRVGSYEAAAELAGFLESQSLPDPNPSTASELVELLPEMDLVLGDRSAELRGRGALLALTEAVDHTTVALRAAGDAPGEATEA